MADDRLRLLSRTGLAMKYLIFCPCGHSLEAHSSDGCEGERRSPCTCPYDQERALDAAVERARSDAVLVWKKPGIPDAAATGGLPEI